MALIVQKYGGTSVANAERIKNVARRVAERRRQGDQVIVVVSAMSGVTDRLIRLAKSVCAPLQQPPEREMDMLLTTGEQTTIALTAIALQTLNISAVSLTGAQAGIQTDGVHTKARIQNITPKQVHQLLDAGHVVIIAGFQGQTQDGRLTTLGRGGSDLTAIAIAAAVRADLCQIYTDVDGVYTADPRILPQAKKIQEISYDEMLELASAGAKVMQSRSVEFAKKFCVPFEIRSSLNYNPGTIVKEETANMEHVVVRGISIDKNQAKITLLGVPDQPGVAAQIFQALHHASINVDMIVQNVGRGPKSTTDLSFTIDRADLPQTQTLIHSLAPKIGFTQALRQKEIGKLSIVGVGMKSHSGIAAKLFQALADQNVNIDMISTSEIKLSVIVDLSQSETALSAAHNAFLR